MVEAVRPATDASTDNETAADAVNCVIEALTDQSDSAARDAQQETSDACRSICESPTSVTVPRSSPQPSTSTALVRPSFFRDRDTATENGSAANGGGDLRQQEQLRYQLRDTARTITPRYAHRILGSVVAYVEAENPYFFVLEHIANRGLVLYNLSLNCVVPLSKMFVKRRNEVILPSFQMILYSKFSKNNALSKYVLPIKSTLSHEDHELVVNHILRSIPVIKTFQPANALEELDDVASRSHTCHRYRCTFRC